MRAIFDVEQMQYSIVTCGNESLLSLMQRVPLPVRNACKNGGCGVCRCRLVSGEITYQNKFPFALWQADIDQGMILPCIAFVVSDVLIDKLTLKV
tara:strand:+ start:398 stop:682 length:285 start_codon:yes stop_codon:yes gene_type:complete